VKFPIGGIRARLVLVLVGAGLALSATEIWYELAERGGGVERDAIRSARRQLDQVRPILERFYSGGDAGTASVVLEGLESPARPRVAVLVDARARVIASNTPGLAGGTLSSAIPGADARRLRRELDAGRHAIETRADHRRILAATLVNPREPRAPGGPPRPFLLVVDCDLAPAFRAVRMDVLEETASFLLRGLVVLVLLWLLLDWRVTRPAARIARAASRFAEGDRHARTGLSGADEIHRVGRAFDRMAERIQSAEDEAQGTRSLLDGVLQSLPLGVVVIDRATRRLRFANARWRQLMGVDAPLGTDFEDLIGHLGIERPDGTISPREQLTVPTVLRTGQPAQRSLVYVHPDGSRVPVLVSALPVGLDSRGRFDAVVSVAQDRRELEQALSELREWEQRYEAVVESTGQVVYDWDARTGRMHWSGSVRGVLGYRPEEIEGACRIWRERIHPDDLPGVLAEFEACHGDPARKFEATYRFRHADGGWRSIRDRGFYRRGPDGEIARMLGTMADVTDQHRLEEQLREAQRMETVGRLAGGVAHDFNNQLTGVIGHLDLLRVSIADDDPRQEHIQIARAAAGRCAELTRGLLAYGRRLATQPRRIQVNEVAARIEPMLRRVLPDSIRLEVALEPSPWPVLADASQLEEVLMNLCLNARDAMPEGGDLKVATRNVELAPGALLRHPDARPGHFVEIAVSDSGGGMPPQVQAHIFDPFFSTKQRGTGTGLGLSMVYGIIASHRGWIEVDSRAGAGSTFRIYLECADAQACPDRPPAGVVRAGRPRVLVVDDQTLVLDLAARALEAAGFDVLAATSGREAIGIVRSRPGSLDAVVLDLNLPDVPGPEVMREILALEPGVGIVRSSGEPEADAGASGAGAPATFLAKPYPPARLIEAVRECLRAPRPMAAGQPRGYNPATHSP
jgi:PAS domain S-box-containing protein